MVLKLTGYRNQQSLNGTYGGKYADYIDIKNVVVDSAEHFRSLYFQGFLKKLESFGAGLKKGHAHYDAFLLYRDNLIVQQWLEKFLERTFLREFEALSKKKPTVEESSIWIGQKNAEFGVLVTPRFVNGVWENDKSEIRQFKPKYWTIGHILKTGFVVPKDVDRIEFSDVDEYLTFFKNVLVRNSGSQHEYEIAKRYCDYVKNSPIPEDVPLLIPELRYKGIDLNH